MRRFAVRALPCVFLLQLGCSSQEDLVFARDGNLESKPKATMLADVQQAAMAAAADEDAVEVAARVKYKLRVTTKSGATLCNGETVIEILSDFSLAFPDAFVDCVSLHIDLGAILGAQVDSRLGGEDQLKHDGKVLSVRAVAGAEFDPPRPLLLGPIVQNAKKYQGFKRSSRHALTATSEAGEPVSGIGTFDIAVIDAATTYSDPSEADIYFDKVLHWEMQSQFDTPAKYGLTFDRITWLWSTRPIMIPGIIVEGTLKDFIETDSVEVIDAIAGPLKVEIFVREYEIR